MGIDVVYRILPIDGKPRQYFIDELNHGLWIAVPEARDLHPIDGDRFSTKFAIYGGKLEIYSLDRYFGEHYPSGYWPRHKKIIEFCQKAFPDHAVYYGGDHDDDLDECTEDFMKKMDEVWSELGVEKK